MGRAMYTSVAHVTTEKRSMLRFRILPPGAASQATGQPLIGQPVNSGGCEVGVRALGTSTLESSDCWGMGEIYAQLVRAQVRVISAQDMSLGPRRASRVASLSLMHNERASLSTVSALA